MNARERVLRFRRLKKSSAAWSLLRAQRAPEILGFLQTLFAGDGEVSIAQARNLLNVHISDWQSEYADTDVTANGLLAQWVREGYIRDQDGHYMMTDPCVAAIKFVDDLDKREVSATATHLRIVQDSVDDLLFSLEADALQRGALVEAKMNELRREHERIMAGDFELPNEFEQRESVRTIFGAAQRLAGDFRLLDDQYRDRGQELFEQMNAADAGRGAVVESALDHEDELKRTPAGQAFEGFYQMLADTDSRREFQAKIKRLMRSSAGEHLTQAERRFLQNLTGELMEESQRVLKRRKRMSTALSGYVRTANQAERKAIDNMLEEGKRLALELAKREDISVGRKMRAEFDVGDLSLYSPDALRLGTPKASTFDIDVVTNVTDDKISEEQAAKLDRFQVIALAKRLVDFIQSTDRSTATIGDFARAVPMTRGMEELIGAFRIAKATGAVDAHTHEDIEFFTKDGERCRARVPMMIVGLDGFPDDLRDLDL